jgi:hypothetical protein
MEVAECVALGVVVWAIFGALNDLTTMQWCLSFLFMLVVACVLALGYHLVVKAAPSTDDER